jgi:hypothetical protein
MFGAIPPSIAAEAILIMAWRGVQFLEPFVAVAALWGLVNRTDRIIAWLFPHLEWERDLGWLNIRAERRANTALRCLGYAIYLLLVVSLLGIVWAATGVDELPLWPDPMVIGDVMWHLAVMTICLGLWTVFLGAWLIPKIRREREETELKRFRESFRANEQEREWRSRRGPSRVKSSQPMPRKNTPDEAFVLNRPGRLRWPPGG